MCLEEEGRWQGRLRDEQGNFSSGPRNQGTSSFCPQRTSTAEAVHMTSVKFNIHPHAVFDKRFTNSEREECGHLYRSVVKPDISRTTGAHESQEEGKFRWL